MAEINIPSAFVAACVALQTHLVAINFQGILGFVYDKRLPQDFTHLDVRPLYRYI
jgi:hypothetical protein